MVYTEIVSQNVPPHPLGYICCRPVDSVIIDGNLEEKSWQLALWTNEFIDIEGPEKDQPDYRTSVKMLWDCSYLYIAAYLEEPHLWATLTQRESIIYQDNDFEIFIDPVADNHHYAEIEINIYGTIMDLLIARPYRNVVVPAFGWDCKSMKHAVYLDGTINDPSDTDSSWTVEMAIPLKSITDLVHNQKLPVAGDQWRINFSRVQWDTEIVDGNYKKLKKPEHNWVWSPQWAINMHRPEYWGYLQFSDNYVGMIKDEFIPDSLWLEKMQVMAIYEAEVIFFEHNKRYASGFLELKLPAFVDTSKIEIEAGKRHFTVFYDLGEQWLLTNNTSKLWQEVK